MCIQENVNIEVSSSNLENTYFLYFYHLIPVVRSQASYPIIADYPGSIYEI